MAVVVAGSGVSFPCCKPTKDQLAWIATRLRWVLDAFYLTHFLTHHSPDHRRGLTFRLRLRRFIRAFSDRAYFRGQKSSCLSLSNTRLHTRECGEYVQTGG
jgi:hypothetical protein